MVGRRSCPWRAAVLVVAGGVLGTSHVLGATTLTPASQLTTTGAAVHAGALRFLTVPAQADTFTEVGVGVPTGNAPIIAADGSPTRVAFLRFDLTALPDNSAIAVLRLHVADESTVVGAGSDSGGSVYAVSDDSWSEPDMVAASQPAVDGLRGDTLGPVVSGQWVEFDVSRLVRGGGVLSLAVTSSSVDGVRFDSRENAAFAPELKVAVGWTRQSPPGSVVLAAVGDMSCPRVLARSAVECRQRDVSDAIVHDPEVSALLALGDLQYQSGELVEFQGPYETSYGRLKDITFPAVGNHEYVTAGASGYYAYFGQRAGDPAKGYYSFDLGPAWHVVSLNSNCAIVSCAVGSAQEQWLRADLAASSRRCTILMWHHPRFSSSSVHGNDPAVAPLWQAAVDANVELVLTGHDHTYERFAPQNNDGSFDPSGPREFVVGTGGRSLYPFGATVANSEVRIGSDFGFLRLTLNTDSYGWEFRTETRAVMDRGSEPCRA